MKRFSEKMHDKTKSWSALLFIKADTFWTARRTATSSWFDKLTMRETVETRGLMVRRPKAVSNHEPVEASS